MNFDLSIYDDKELFDLASGINYCIHFPESFSSLFHFYEKQVPDNCSAIKFVYLDKFNQFKAVSSKSDLSSLLVQVADSLILRQKHEILASQDVRKLINPAPYFGHDRWHFEFINAINSCIYFDDSEDLSTTLILRQCEQEDYPISCIDTQSIVDENFSKYECALLLSHFANTLKNHYSLAESV